MRWNQLQGRLSLRLSQPATPIDETVVPDVVAVVVAAVVAVAVNEEFLILYFLTVLEAYPIDSSLPAMEQGSSDENWLL